MRIILPLFLVLAGCCTSPVAPSTQPAAPSHSSQVERYFSPDDYERVRFIVLAELSRGGRAVFDERTGRVTIWDDDTRTATILSALGSALRNEPYPPGELPGDAMEVVEFAYTEEAETTITQLISEDARMLHNPDRSMIVVYDYPDRLTLVKRAVAAFEAD